MKKVKEDIQNRSFERVYLFYGEESYLVREALSLLTAAIAGTDTMNRMELRDEIPDFSSLVSFTDTLPFFAEKRFLVLDHTNLFRLGNPNAEAWISSLPETAVVVITEDTVDKRQSLYKAIEKTGYVAEFSQLSEADIGKYVLHVIGAAKLNITKAAFELLMTELPEQISDVKNEMEKLLSYVFPKDAIYPEDIRAVITPKIENRVYEMVEDMIHKNRDVALKKYKDCLRLQEEPRRILSIVGREIERLILVKEAKCANRTDGEAAKIAGISDRILWKYGKEANHFSKEELLRIFNRILDYQYEMNCGNIADRTAFELLLYELTEKEPRTRTAG